MKKTIGNNVLHFPGSKPPSLFDSDEGAMVAVNPWMNDNNVGIVQVNSSVAVEGFFQGDKLILNRRFEISQIKAGDLVVAQTAKGNNFIRTIAFEHGQMMLRSSDPTLTDIKYGPRIRIEGIVMELQRPLALAA